MGLNMRQEFTAIIKQHEHINGAYVEIPFDVQGVFGAKRIKVSATFDGYKYQGSIVRMDGCYLLGITQQIRKEINKNFGETVLVTVEKDETEREVELDMEFETELNKNESAKNFWDTLSFSNKKKFADWIAAAKKADTRTNRIGKAIIMLCNNSIIK